MAREARARLPFEARVCSKMHAGAFSRRDCTVAFYGRIDALPVQPMTRLKLGAANILTARSDYRRKLQAFGGRVQRVIGLDVDPAVLKSPVLDEAHVIEIGEPYPLEGRLANIVVSDHVLEHFENPDEFAAEDA